MYLLELFRSPLPDSPGDWTPGRVYEVMGAVVGYISAFILYPVNNDFIFSISIAIGILHAVYCAVLYGFIFKLLYKINGNSFVCFFLSLLLFIFYFLIFKTRSNSLHLLSTPDGLTAFLYVLSDLLNSSLVCFLIGKTIIEEKNISVNNLGIYKLSILILFVYFSVLSILFSNTILICFAAFYLLIQIKNKKTVKNILLHDAFYVFAALLYLLYLYLEMTSGRAGQSKMNVFSAGYLTNISNTIASFMKLIQDINKIFFVSTIIPIIFALIVYLNSEAKELFFKRISVLCVFSIFFLTVFYIIANAKNNPAYAYRPDIMYGIFFYYILYALISIAYILKKIPYMIILLPLFIIVQFFHVIDARLGFANDMSAISSNKKREIMTGWVEEMKQADKNGDTSIILKLPKEYDNHWREDLFCSRFSNVLFLYKITTKKIAVDLQTY